MHISHLSNSCGATNMKAHMTQWSNIRDMRDQSLWCFCTYFSSPYGVLRRLWQHGVYWTFKKNNRGPNQLRGLCFFFLVLRRVVLCSLCRSLPSLISFILPAIAAQRGLLCAPGARDHCALPRNKREHIPSSSNGPLPVGQVSSNKAKSTGEVVLALSDLRSCWCGLSSPIRSC